MRKIITAVCLLLLSLPGYAERYSPIPQVFSSHSDGLCQYFYEKGSKDKRGIVSFRVFATCDAVQEIYSAFIPNAIERKYHSKIDWFKGDCLANVAAWDATLYFSRQFWDGAREKANKADPIKDYDFIKMHSLYGDILDKVCQKNIDVKNAT